MHVALEEAGFKSIHWGWYDPPSHMPRHVVRQNKGVTLVGAMIKHAKKSGFPLLHFLNDYNAFIQMDVTLGGELNYWPQLTDVPLLDQQYPNSKFIFNTRPMDKWLSSVNRWGNLKLRLTKAELPGLPFGVGYKDEELENWHNWHKENMVSYFKDSPEKFIIFDIENDKPSILVDFLGVNTIKIGHENENKRNPPNHSSHMSSAIHS